MALDAGPEEPGLVSALMLVLGLSSETHARTV